MLLYSASTSAVNQNQSETQVTLILLLCNFQHIHSLEGLELLD